jgi:predicted alpha/beta-hydrolase family hydrolase
VSAEPHRIPAEKAPDGAVDALFDAPRSDEQRSAVLLAHGSGGSMDTPLLADFADALAERGFAVLRFQYPYRQRALARGRNAPPDRAPVLEATHRDALALLAELAPGRPVLLAGKSLGGRMGTRIAADGAECAGLVLLGYPLHPPRKPEKLRSDHFERLRVPALFLQGTRDTLCDLDLLRRELGSYAGPWTLHVLEDGDHGLGVPKRAKRTEEEVLGELVDAVDAWERATITGNSE